MPAGRPRMPLERAQRLAAGDGRRPSGRELSVAPTASVAPRRTDIPTPPAVLAERGTAEWTKIWTAGYWLHDDKDYHWVEMITTAYDEIETFRAQIAEDGLVVSGYNGQMTAHPLISEIRKAQAVIAKALSLIGFSPSDRARLGLMEVKQASALDEMLAKRAKRG